MAGATVGLACHGIWLDLALGIGWCHSDDASPELKVISMDDIVPILVLLNHEMTLYCVQDDFSRFL